MDRAPGPILPPWASSTPGLLLDLCCSTAADWSHSDPQHWMTCCFRICWQPWYCLGYLVVAVVSREYYDALVQLHTLDARLLARELTFGDIIGIPSVRSLIFAKFMSDSAWYFSSLLVAEMPLRCTWFHDIKQVSYYGWIPPMLHLVSGLVCRRLFLQQVVAQRTVASGSCPKGRSRPQCSLHAGGNACSVSAGTSCPFCYSALHSSVSNHGQGSS